MAGTEKKIAVIIGGGPAGLTAALELLAKTAVHPVILEKTGLTGGISKTIEHNGNRMDIGGHRFFSKSDRVMDWWFSLFALQGKPAKDDLLLGRQLPLSDRPGAPDPEKDDRVLLVRHRCSRIYYLRKFFDYPVTLSAATVRNLGLLRMTAIFFSYVRARLFPVRPEDSLEAFMINRFGGELYRTFFRDYTQKVWGIDPSGIQKDWGAQRIKGLSVTRVLAHAVKGLFRSAGDIRQKETETSLISQFVYPKYGPGQLWNEVADRVVRGGGEVRLNSEAVGIEWDGTAVSGVRVKDAVTGDVETIAADYVFSTMPVKDLIAGMGAAVPAEVRRVAGGLQYRDYITVGLLVDALAIKNETKIRTVNNIVPDLWIYIQEKDVRIGRLQIYNNWSPYLVKDPGTVFVGTEYFCNEGDDLWQKSDEEMAAFAVAELVKIGVLGSAAVRDRVVVREKKVYPAYFGTFAEFDTVRRFTDRFANLFLVGRNGMHHYNNMDHSMLTAMAAVDNVAQGVATKDNIWSVNSEDEYLEENKQR